MIGSIVSVYPPKVKLSPLILEQLVFPGSKEEGYFVYCLTDGEQLVNCHCQSHNARNLCIIVGSLYHLVGMSNLLSHIINNNNLEAPSTCKEVADCLDSYKGGSGRMQYRLASFDFKVAEEDQPYHEVCER